MSMICGWANHTNSPSEPLDTLKSMLKMPSNSTHEYVNSNIHTVSTLTTTKDRTSTYKNDSILVGVSGYPYLDETPSDQNSNFAGMVAKLYLSIGTECLEKIKGSFSIVIVNLRTNETLLAIDRMGTSNLAYYVKDNALFFANNASTIFNHPHIDSEIDSQSIFNYVYFHMIPGPTTIYKKCYRVKPGHYIRFKNSNITEVPYWKINFNEITSDSEDVLEIEFMEILRNSVKKLQGHQKIGTFLSGGTDSSTITGILSQLSDNPVDTYSIGFEADGYDEMEYAKLAAKHFACEHHQYYVTPQDVVDAIPMIAQAYDQPFGNASAVPTFYCAKLAKEDGIEVLLGGDGGDELFGGNDRYAKQYIFSFYNKTPSVIRKYLLEPLIFSPLFTDAILPFRKIKSYVSQANIPLPDRMESYNLLERIGPSVVFTTDFLESIRSDVPLSLIRDVYNNIDTPSELNKLLAVDFQFTLADNDLPKVTNMCHQAKLDVLFPLLDDDLVKFSEKLPTNLKLNKTTLRYFFKKSLRNFLPTEILTKEKHGFGLPYGVWLNSHPPLLELTKDSLTDLKKRNIIDEKFLDTLINSYVTQHASYYGTLVWVLVILEHWFKSHIDSD